jgi:hypothetical protein
MLSCAVGGVSMIRRLFPRRRPDPRQLLVQDTVRIAGYMEAVQAQARDLDAPDTVDLVTSLLILRMWLVKVRAWAEE